MLIALAIIVDGTQHSSKYVSQRRRERAMCSAAVSTRRSSPTRTRRYVARDAVSSKLSTGSMPALRSAWLTSITRKAARLPTNRPVV